MLPAATEHKELRTFPGRQTAATTPAWGPHTHGVLVVIAAKRRRGGRRRPPSVDQCRVPPRDRQARRGRHPRCRRAPWPEIPPAAPMPGAWKPKSGGPVPSTRSPMLPADLAEARPLLSAAKHLRLPRRCPRRRHTGRQPGTPAALL